MGNAIVFDTHIFVKKLQEVGFTEKQAEALSSAQTDLLEGNLATKLDIAAIQRDIAEIRRDMKEMEIRLKYDLTLRLGGMMAASIALVAALVKLL